MFIKLCRIGNSPEIRYTPAGKAVMNLSLAYQYGRKGDDGKRPTQWIEASVWDKQAEGLQPYLNKGDQIEVCLDDLHNEDYEGKNGRGYKMIGRVTKIDFVGKSQEAPSQGPGSKLDNSKAGNGFADMDDDIIPF